MLGGSVVNGMPASEQHLALGARPRAVQLLQYAVTPRLESASLPAAMTPAGLFPAVLANYLVEQAERHAVHHFCIEELGLDGSVRPRMLLWLFQPSLGVVCSGAGESFSGQFQACKVLYQGEAAAGAAVGAGSGAFPLPMDAVHCAQLEHLLYASNQTYVSARQALGAWRIGWLPRGPP